jgi:hypothetical protein
MWRIESDPVLRSPIIVGLLDRVPTDADVRAALAVWQQDFPRLRQRIVPAPRLQGGARWVECDEPSLDYHARRVRAPQPHDLHAVLAVVEPIAMAAFDGARPLWELTIVEGVGRGRAAMVLRFHHSLTDGVGGVALASQLFDRSRRPRRRRQHSSSLPDRTTALQRSIGTTLQVTADVTRFGLDAVRHPLATIDGGRRLARSLGKALAPMPRPVEGACRI